MKITRSQHGFTVSVIEAKHGAILLDSPITETSVVETTSCYG
jgi:hypothetical protein